MIFPELLDANLSPVRRIQPVKASVRLNLTPLSTAELDLMPGDTIPARSLVSMYTVQGFAGVFRTSTTNETYGQRSTQVRLEHAVAEIGDWIVGSEIEESVTTAASAITALFASYGGTLWSLGTLNCSVNVRHSASKGTNVLEGILAIVNQVPGYMLTLDQTVTPWQLGITQKPDTVTAEGRLSRNMQSVQITYDDSELCNKVYISGIDTPFEAYDSQATYGVIELYINENDLPTATAQMVAIAYLQAHCDPAISVNISMLDLANVTGETLDRITLGKKFRLALPDDNVTIEQHVISIQFNDVYGNPEAISVTLANEISDTVAYLKKQRRSGRGSKKKIDKLEEEHKRYETKFTQNDRYFQLLATDSEWTAMGEQHVTAYSRITQSSEQIQSVVVQTGTSVLAKPFDETHTYAIGDLCTVNGVVYEFIAAHEGQWNPADVVEKKTLVSQINQTADEISTVITETGAGWETFSPVKTYHVGDRVTYLGKNYICSAEHSPGDFTTNHFTLQNTLRSQITQNATEISQKVSQGDLAGYMTISAMRTAFGNSAVASDGTITKAEFSTSVVDGVASAGITADKISLNGNATLSGKLSVNNDGLTTISGSVGIGNIGTGIVSINGGSVTAQEFDVRIGGHLKFVTGGSASGGNTYYDLTSTVVGGMVKTVSHDTSTNTLTLTKFDGTVINFSKAATPVTLTGLWSGSTYTATPSSGTSVSTTVSLKSVSDLTITSSDSPIQTHGKLYAASGTVTIKATTGELDGQGNPVYTDILTSSFSNKDITSAYNDGWTAGNQAPSTTTVTGSWSQGTYTATAMPQNVQAETSLYGIVLNGDITKNTVIPKAINVPLKVVWDDDDPQTDAADKPSTGFTESISVDASLIYTDGQNSVSATFGTYSGTPGTTPTALSAGTYEFKITKDGTATTQTFYSVPSAPAVVRKVSKGSWGNGSIDFTASDTGADSYSLKLYTSGAYSGTLDSALNPTKVSFNILEDTGSGTTAATGATIYANISTTTGTLKLSDFDDTNNRFTVSLDTKPSVSVGGSSGIQPGVTQMPIAVTKGTAQPNTPTWNENAHTYTITADGSFTVGGQPINQTQGFIDGGFVPSDAIAYGQNQAKGISSITCQQVGEPAYRQAVGYTEIPVESNGYYILAAKPVMGNTVYRRFHAPASGGGTSDRWVMSLNPITLESGDTETATKQSFAIYSDGNTETDASKITSVQIDASAVYQAGVSAGLGGVVNVEKTAWANGSATFKPSIGNGSSVQIQVHPIPNTKTAANATETGSFYLYETRENVKIHSVPFAVKLAKTADGQYVNCTTQSWDVSEYKLIARLPINGTPGGEERLINTLTRITLSESDTGTTNKTTDATFDVGSPQTGVPIQIDASKVYAQGLTDGSKYKIEPTHSSGSLTQNNHTYRISPSAGYNGMAVHEFTVNVPTYEGISSATVSHSDDTASTSWNRQLGNGTLNKKYAEITVTANDGTTKGFFLDASPLYERGVTDGSGGTYRQRNATDIDDVTLKATETGTSTHTKTVYYDSGANGTLSVTVNAGAVYQAGRTDGLNNVPKTAISCSENVKSIGTDKKNYEYAGSISKSGLVANSYLSFKIKVGKTEKTFYISVNT